MRYTGQPTCCTAFRPVILQRFWPVAHAVLKLSQPDSVHLGPCWRNYILVVLVVQMLRLHSPMFASTSVTCMCAALLIYQAGLGRVVQNKCNERAQPHR